MQPNTAAQRPSDDSTQQWTPVELPEELHGKFIDPSYAFIPPRERTCPECGGIMYLEPYDCDDHIEDVYECDGCDHFERA